jgi:hypothetical protein
MPLGKLQREVVVGNSDWLNLLRGVRIGLRTPTCELFLGTSHELGEFGIVFDGT